MVAQIGPLVQVGNRYRVALNHVAGGAAGGLLAGVVLGLLSTLIGAAVALPEAVVLAALGIALVGACAADAAVIRPGTLGLSRQTPRTWSCSFGEPAAVFAWGFDLGLVLSTRLTTYGVVVLPVFALVSGSFLLTCAVFVAYGTARSLVVGAMALEAGGEVLDASRELGDRQPILLRIAAVASLVSFGTMLIVWLG